MLIESYGFQTLVARSEQRERGREESQEFGFREG